MIGCRAGEGLRIQDIVGRTAGLTVELEHGYAALGLEQRLKETPPTAHVRGVFFRLAEQALETRSKDLLATWRAEVGARHRWPFKLYPTRDCIREQALAAVLLRPDDPGEAIREMWVASPRFSRLLRADRFVRYLTGSEPTRALAWLERNRDMMCDYGGWRVDITGPTSATFHYLGEYVWIEHAHRGGVEGTLSRCGVTPTITPDLDTPYNGRLLIQWT